METKAKSSHESFKNFATGVQNWVIAVAVVVGGAWTLYTFVTLDMQGRAERELFRQAQLKIEIDAAQESPEGADQCIAAIVRITNTGSRNTFLDYSGNPFSVTKIEFDQKGNSRFGQELKQRHLLSQSRVLRTGEAVEYPFFVTVSEPGMYLVQFRVYLPEGELEEHLKAGGSQGGIFWLGSTYVNVRF